MEVNIFERIQLGYYLCAALSFIAGMLVMAVAAAERGDLEEEENDDFDQWID